MNKINFKHLILLVAILFVLNFVISKNSALKRIMKGITKSFTKKESFDNLIEDIPVDKKNKSCSQDSVNYGINNYIFAKTPFARP